MKAFKLTDSELSHVIYALTIALETSRDYADRKKTAKSLRLGTVKEIDLNLEGTRNRLEVRRRTWVRLLNFFRQTLIVNED